MRRPAAIGSEAGPVTGDGPLTSGAKTAGRPSAIARLTVSSADIRSYDPGFEDVFLKAADRLDPPSA